MNKSYFYCSISDFIQMSNEEILGQLVSSEKIFNITPKSTYAWEGEISILKNSLSDLSGFIHFEFMIPRVGKRVDVLIIIKNIIFIIEFKVGSESYDVTAITQVYDYALDLKNFHEGSHDKIILPILISTKAEDRKNHLVKSKDNIYDIIFSNGENINKIINQILDIDNTSKDIDHNLWLNSSYKPTPNIIEAAQALYEGHTVEEISRSDAGATNLSVTSNKLSKIILYSKKNKKKTICFVTGVPGAGKTLVGLNVATDQSESIGLGKETVFLSGNGPLVKVLSEALARNKVTNAKLNGEKYAISDARREVKKFIQNIHHFRDEYLNANEPPYEKVVIFDESQRAWNMERLHMKMKEKGHIINLSEPDLLISHMDKHEDWCVIICLVGGGQEINKGEAGISTWIESMDKNYTEWDVYLSNQITNPEYLWGYDYNQILNSSRTIISENLHLSVSLRSFRSEKLSRFMNEIISGNIQNSINLKKYIKDYPTKITRDLEKAKEWLRNSARGSERYGLVAEANAIRLKADGVFVKSEIEPENWFLSDRSDVRSSYYLEDVATEYHIQGLELDWVCLCWDAGLRRNSDKWEFYRFLGNSYKKRNKEEEKKYLINAYRVLLTRARQGIVVFMPKGDISDPTRAPSYYNETYDYLLNCGFEEID